MKELTIYNVYVEMESQEQCDRIKQLCIDNNLPYWKGEKVFNLKNYIDNYFSCVDSEFCLYLWHFSKTKVTEQEFIELLKQHKMTKEQSKFENIEQMLIENMADFLDEENVFQEECILGIKDPKIREESKLHIRMAKAAMIEYKKTMINY